MAPAAPIHGNNQLQQQVRGKIPPPGMHKTSGPIHQQRTQNQQLAVHQQQQRQGV